MEVGLEIGLAKKAPSTNVIKRVLEEKTYFRQTGQRCIYKTLDYSFSLMDRFTVISKMAAAIMLFMLNQFKSNNVMWMNAKHVYETNLFFYLRKGAEDGRLFKAM